ncbi:hypothetical protein OTBS_1399 [Orientia tsutsugamushi str. Boryong]|uniref:Uncharacterized protein n=1 Tax=Orientia tsutsugamushi (strain Boryong) TaxID=357244 RepID=A5CED8_ORITB|nr:hypothetical protein OTBS_1399 [Orientia tsutsugamushi str. Boryong]
MYTFCIMLSLLSLILNWRYTQTSLKNDYIFADLSVDKVLLLLLVVLILE